MDDFRPAPLLNLPLEKVRVRSERTALDLAREKSERRWSGEPDPEPVRERLLRHALPLSPTEAPRHYELAYEAARVLGRSERIELFHSNGCGHHGNAHMAGYDGAILIEIIGRWLFELDRGTSLAVMGHELGHYLMHLDAESYSTGMAPDDPVPGLWLARELTADRFGLLVCQDLAAAVRCEMISVSGLPSDSLAWDTAGYLRAATTHVEGLLASGRPIWGTTHPEPCVRTFAVGLFSESDLYRELTGRGPGTRPMEEIDEVLKRLLGTVVREQSSQSGSVCRSGDIEAPFRPRFETWFQEAVHSAGAAIDRKVPAVGRLTRAVREHVADALRSTDQAETSEGADACEVTDPDEAALLERFRALEERLRK